MKRNDGSRGLTLERLRGVFSFDPLTGLFTWKNPTCNRAKIGAVVGSRNGKYHQIRLDGFSYKAHRLAWFYVHGEWPSSEIDHKNRIPTDNRMENLRLADHSQNTANSKARPNKNGYKGVDFKSRTGKFYGVVKRWGIRRYSAGCDSAEEAHAEYCRLSRMVYGEFFDRANQQIAVD